MWIQVWEEYDQDLYTAPQSQVVAKSSVFNRENKNMLIRFSTPKSFIVCRNLLFGLLSTHVFSEENLQAENIVELTCSTNHSQPKSVEPLESVNNAGFRVWGSYLYWQPRQDYMDVMLVASPGSYNTVSGISWSQGSLIQMPAHMASGSKAGLAVSGAFCEVQSEYTRLHTQNHISKTAPANGNLFGRWIQPNIVSDNKASYINTTWRLSFDNLNIEMGKPLKASSRLVLKPTLGVAFAWISQHVNSEMFLSDSEISELPNVDLSIKNQSHSLGIGPRLGIDGTWTLWSSPRSSFDLIGHIAGDLLVTRYHLELNQQSSNEDTLFIHSKNTITVMQPEVEIYFALSYIYRALRLELGYDAQVWFYQNMIRWYNDTTYISVPRGNLSFAGPRATLGLNF